MKYIIFSLFSLCSIYLSGFSQNIVMTQHNNQTVSSCSSSFSLGSYTVGTNYTITISSTDPLAKHVVAFLYNYSFPDGTSLCVYDGEDDSSPLLVCWDHTTSSGSVAAQAKKTNETGSLTLVFNSSVEGASFSGSLFCEFICEPRTVAIVATNPPLTGDTYVDICWDGFNNQTFPISFTAQGTYPEVGYQLDDSNVIFRWDFQDGQTVIEGEGLNEITHSFNNRDGFILKLTTIDTQDCETQMPAFQKIRISLAPEWELFSASTDEICMGEGVELCAEFTESVTNWVTNEILPLVGDEMPLPDGTGICYENSIVFTHYEPNQLVVSVDDFKSICMNIVHSYMGDLSFFLECPNGQTVQLQRQQGGSTDLGEPSLTVGTPGIGYWYCITNEAEFTMGEVAAGISGGTLPEGNYASYQTLTNLIGCPLNGEWILRICDNWAQDEGHIFGWYINFDEALFPDTWSYSNSFTPTGWTGMYGSQITDHVNENCYLGTYITTETPEENSTQSFFFTLIDNFGCEHQTSLEIFVYGENLCPEDTTFLPQNYIAKKDFLLLPNPSADFVKVLNIPDNSELIIYDIKGAMRLKTDISNYDTISVSDLKAGTYLFIVKSPVEEILISKFVKDY